MNHLKVKALTLISIIFLLACSGSKSISDVPLQKSQTLDASKWKLLSIRGKKPKYNDSENQITIAFNVEAKTINGYSGCNRYFGNFTDYGSGKIKISEIGSTKRACPSIDMDLEQSFLQSLRKIDSYIFVNSELQLLQNEKVIFIFEEE